MPNTPRSEFEDEIKKLGTEKILEAIKTYDDRSDAAKSRVWTITTWILAINTGLIAFIVDYTDDHSWSTYLALITVLASGAGVVLCSYLILMINDQGEHIRGNWKTANEIAYFSNGLKYLVKESNVSSVGHDSYWPAYPRFCDRLKVLTWIYLIGIVGLCAVLVLASYYGLLAGEPQASAPAQ